MSLRVVLGGRCGVQAGRVLEFPADSVVSSSGHPSLASMTANDLVAAMRAQWPADASDGVDFDSAAVNLLHSGRVLPASARTNLTAPGDGDALHLHLVFRSAELVAAAERRKADERAGAGEKRKQPPGQERRVRQDDGGCCIVA
uniref:Uncharacterized protein n=1 Tax=Neobodo designis TaxID=312471 RepID=A0A7S1R3Z9_NEODS|mmetsp:Transcript_774/g.2684  ORF Transcript_774/g.2684 Transcript_774/m.2684 type:complete len:144 (+) Transcript_774:93-524(+)